MSDLQKDVTVKYKVTDFVSGEVIVESECLARANESNQIFAKPMSDGEKRFYLIEWEYTLDGAVVKGKNHYVTNIIDLDYDEYRSWIKKAGFDEFEGF